MRFFILWMLVTGWQAHRQTPAAPFVEASYGYSSEASYVKIEVKGGKIRYTYNARNSLLKVGQPMIRQQPYYTASDLTTRESALAAEELRALARQIESSGFLRLRPSYQAKKNVRSYPATVAVAVRNGRRGVTVINGPPPKPFREVTRTLFVLMRKHFVNSVKGRR